MLGRSGAAERHYRAERAAAAEVTSERQRRPTPHRMGLVIDMFGNIW